MRSEKKWLGPSLIGAAALLWASDALFRFPLVGKLDPTLIVFSEHVIAVVALFPWILLKRAGLRGMSPVEWGACAFLGAGASAFATVFFTASFNYINPSIAILLQKLQPAMVVIFAYLILRERPARGFWGWAMVALASGIVVSFPDLDFTFLRSGLDLRSKGVFYCLSAAFIWAFATVVGKHLLKKRPPEAVTFIRFVFGLGTLLGILALSGAPVAWNGPLRPGISGSLLYMGFVPGLAAMILYYSGLKRTPAAVTTFVELLFPVGAVVLNTVFLNTPLNAIQIGAGIVLLASVTVISRL